MATTQNPKMVILHYIFLNKNLIFGQQWAGSVLAGWLNETCMRCCFCKFHFFLMLPCTNSLTFDKQDWPSHHRRPNIYSLLVNGHIIVNEPVPFQSLKLGSLEPLQCIIPTGHLSKCLFILFQSFFAVSGKFCC